MENNKKTQTGQKTFNIMDHVENKTITCCVPINMLPFDTHTTRITSPTLWHSYNTTTHLSVITNTAIQTTVFTNSCPTNTCTLLLLCNSLLIRSYMFRLNCHHLGWVGRGTIWTINTQQERITYRYKNKEKFLKSNTAIKFNEMCRFQHLTPQYMRIT